MKSQVGSIKNSGLAVPGLSPEVQPVPYDSSPPSLVVAPSFGSFGLVLAEAGAGETDQERFSAELDFFLRTVAHEIRQPLCAMVTSADLIAYHHATLPPQDLGEIAREITRMGLKISQMLDDFRLLASVPYTQVELQPLDMAGIMATVQKGLAEMITASQAEISLPAGWPTALGYAPWVEAVWTNYLSNAIKYGGEPPVVELGAAPQTDGLIYFWVSDNGAGLTPTEQNQLFTPFTRLHPDRGDGCGIGLSTVRRIVEKLGGSVGVESENVPGRGSRFSFTLLSA